MFQHIATFFTGERYVHNDLRAEYFLKRDSILCSNLGFLCEHSLRVSSARTA